MKKLISFLVLFQLLGMIGCRLNTRAENFVNDLNNLASSMGNGHNYQLVKDPTRQGKNIYVIWDQTEGTYWAIEWSWWDRRRNGGSDLYHHFMNNKEEVWYDRNGYYVDSRGHLYELTNASSKDLEKMAAMSENIKIGNFAEELSAEYGLSESRSFEIAAALNSWGKLADKRKMTSQDLNAFSKQVLGVKFSDYRKAAIDNNKKKLNKILKSAADFNDVSPEHLQTILNNFAN